jgi:hypothetical protein
VCDEVAWANSSGNAVDIEALEIVGQVAGIGGLALGVFLLLFREIIRKNIFPRLPPPEAYRLLRLIAIAVWSVAIVGIGAWVYTSQRPKKDSSAETQINATCGSVGIAGPVSGATINAGGATNSNCATKPN